MYRKWRKSLLITLLPGVLLTALLALGGLTYMTFLPGRLSDARATESPQAGGKYVSHAEFEMGCGHCHAPIHCVVDTNCTECHQDVALEQAEVVGLHGRLPGTGECQTCHMEHMGREASISTLAFKHVDHEKLAGFDLINHQVDYADDAMTCQSCHSSMQDVFATLDCVTCHTEEDHELMAEHIQAYGLDCIGCHDGRDRMRDFDHQAAYPLDGAHAIDDCMACHENYIFAGTATECVGCHEDPEFHSGQFGEDCMRCHNTTAWKLARLRVHVFFLDHGEEDPDAAACKSCHSGTYAQHSCDGCHDTHADMQQVHQEEGILDDTDCIACHPTGVQGEGMRIMDEQRARDTKGSVPDDGGAGLLNTIISQPQVSLDIDQAGR
jgi:hypothetical protein